MNVSAVNCTPIKPTVSFGAEKGEYEKVAGLTDQITDSYVNANDIKTPGQVVASVGAAGIKSFASGAIAAGLIAGLFKSAPTKLQGLLKTGSKKVRCVAANLSDDAAKHAKIKKPIGKAIAKTEQVARNVYKKFINADVRNLVDETAENLTDDAVKAAKQLNQEISANATRGFQKLGGALSTAAIVPAILTKDNDGDGVKDLVQKSQSAYSKVDAKNHELTSNLSAMAELASILA